MLRSQDTDISQLFTSEAAARYSVHLETSVARVRANTSGVVLEYRDT
ncbi:hypothetical protein JOF48_003024 [Arthrobacter stackebrandtii]|uniref:Uncharacterized protein n=1 Tax=Arthrobacter stackebrandtii TaxID=272161 RepID=A0ABS4Z092_9MICC|nr:hypothetical protein [Arthrobacter stackebrandtii]MBP2414225.1 hypothetical protein [Arthrobacter stackebrandtii]